MSAIPRSDEQAAQHAAGRRAEHAKWILLGSNDGELDAYHASVGQVRGGQERELIQRERPAEPGWVHEAQALLRAIFESLEQPHERRHALRSAEVQGALQPVAPLSADRDDDGVVWKHNAAREPDGSRLGVDLRQGVHMQLGVVICSDLGKLEEVGLRKFKGCRHRERLVDELAVRGDEVHLHRDLHQRAQRQQRLDRRDAPATDNDASGDFAIRSVVPLSAWSVGCGLGFCADRLAQCEIQATHGRNATPTKWSPQPRKADVVTGKLRNPKPAWDITDLLRGGTPMSPVTLPAKFRLTITPNGSHRRWASS